MNKTQDDTKTAVKNVSIESRLSLIAEKQAAIDDAKQDERAARDDQEQARKVMIKEWSILLQRLYEQSGGKSAGTYELDWIGCEYLIIPVADFRNLNGIIRRHEAKLEALQNDK